MKYKLVILISIAVIVTLWSFYPMFISSDYAKMMVPKGNWALRGVVGDSFGALNALFGGLALAGLGINIYMQSSQIEKLEKRETENEEKIREQSNLLRLTALLNYYGSEIDRLDRLAATFDNSTDSNIEQRLWDRHKKLRLKRDEIVENISAKIS